MSSRDLSSEKEFKCLTTEKMTVLNDSGQYELRPQRGCFERCERCYNLSEADSYEKEGIWFFKAECLFCVQRAINMLGFYEHGIVPTLSPISVNKTRDRERGNDLYEALEGAAELLNNVD